MKQGLFLVAGATALVLGAAAFSQVPPPAATPAGQHKNLKVLPADIPHDRLIAIMRSYTASLGVKCTFCHVGQDGKRETMDFASDANPHKLIARRMMTMTRRINEQDLGVTDFTKSKVTCYTCHRGASEPLTAAADPNAPPPPSHH